MLDMKTVLLSSVISDALVTLFIALLWYRNRKRYAGLSFWLADFVLQMAGMLLQSLRNIAPDFISIVLSNTMIAAGAVFMLIGLERFVGRRRTQVHNYLAVAALAGSMTYYYVIRPDMDVRTIIIHAVIAFLTLQCSWLMFRRTEPSLRPMTWSVGVVFIGYSAVALIRIIHLAMRPLPAVTLLFDMPAAQVLYMLAFQMLNIALMFALIMMVTRRLARDVQTQEQNYASLYNSMREGMALHEIIYDADNRPVDYRVLDVNTAYETILGLKRERVIGETASNLYGTDRAPYLDIYAEVSATGQPVSFDTFFPLMDKYFKVSAFRPEPGQFATIFEDVTERKRAEELIRVRLTLLEFSATHSLDELLQKTLDEVGTLTDSPIGFYHFVSEDQKSLTLQAWSTRTVQEFCKAEGRGMHYGIDQAGVWVDCVREKRPVIHNDYSALQHKKGMPKGHAQVIRELVVPIMRLDKIVAILGVGNKPIDYTDQDISTVSYLADEAWEITIRKRVEEALTESEEKFRGVFETSRDFTFISTIDGRILDNNEAVRDFFGYSSDEIRTMNIRDFYAQPGERERFRDIVVQKGYVEGYELKLRKKDGTIIDGQVTVVTRKDKDGNIIGFQGSVRDVTERRALERQLLQSEKLSTIGTMISGVAHELNNPLTSIIGNVQLLMRKDIPDEAREKLNVVFKESQRSARIVSGLLSFARERKPERRPTNINEIIAESVKSGEYEMGVSNIGVRLLLDDNLPETLCDPFQLLQVFISVINNARDAMVENGGGTLSVRTSRKEDKIVIKIKDNGPGISEECLKRIFDPFFTTKEVGKGTGLGLSMAYGIINEHNGTITADSQPGNGTTFTIMLPIRAPKGKAERRESHDSGHPVQEDALRGAKSILLLDGDDGLAPMISEALSNEGYHVDRCDGCERAVGELEKNRYDLVISDPKTGATVGEGFYHYIETHCPNLVGKVLYVTGGALDLEMQNTLTLAGNRFIEKPFEIGVLLKTVDEIIG
jgi:PAS domain S-box-containing protein